MNFGSLGDVLGFELTEAEERALRLVRPLLGKGRRLTMLEACNQAGVAYSTFVQARETSGCEELRYRTYYDPTDIASDKEAFSFSEKVGVEAQLIEEKKRLNRIEKRRKNRQSR